MNKTDTDKTPQPNPFNSSTLQALLDIQRAIDKQGWGLTDIDDIIAAMQEEKSPIRDMADQLFHLHQYPERKISFIQTTTYDYCPELFTLPHQELILLELMSRIQSPEGYVTVVKNQFVEVLNFTDTERKNLQLYLDDLTKKGFLECIYKPPKGSKKPGEYRINRRIAWIGRQDKHTRNISNIPFKPKYSQVIKQIILNNGDKVSSGTLDEIKTKGVNAEDVDPEEEPVISSSHSNQTDYNKNLEPVQDDNDNIQNTIKEGTIQHETDSNQ